MSTITTPPTATREHMRSMADTLPLPSWSPDVLEPFPDRQTMEFINAWWNDVKHAEMNRRLGDG